MNDYHIGDVIEYERDGHVNIHRVWDKTRHFLWVGESPFWLVPVAPDNIIALVEGTEGVS